MVVVVVVVDVVVVVAGATVVAGPVAALTVASTSAVVVVVAACPCADFFMQKHPQENYLFSKINNTIGCSYYSSENLIDRTPPYSARGAGFNQSHIYLNDFHLLGGRHGS